MRTERRIFCRCANVPTRHRPVNGNAMQCQMCGSLHFAATMKGPNQ